VSQRSVLLFAALVLLFQVQAHSQNLGGSTPQIVARVSLTGQTGPISPTTLLSPTQDAMYRISAVMVITTANSGAGFWSINLGFAPDTGPTTVSIAQISSNQVGGGINFYTTAFRSDAGHPITYSVVDHNGAEGSTYELFIVLERL